MGNPWTNKDVLKIYQKFVKISEEKKDTGHFLEKSLSDYNANFSKNYEPETIEKESELPMAIEDILAPLDEVIFQQELFDEILMKTGIPDLISGDVPKYSGTILRGPPGTGKTVLKEAIEQVYQNAGSVAYEANIAAMTEKYVGTLGKNLDKLLGHALTKSKEIGKSVVIGIDEGTTVVTDAQEGTNLSKYYQGALDVIKKYLNHPEIVMVVTTNSESSLLDNAISRDGRLVPIEVGQPEIEERVKLWEKFLKKYEVIHEPTETQLQTLAETTPKENGSFIEQFTRAYFANVKAEILKEKSGKLNIIDALKTGTKVTNEEVNSSINFKKLLEDINQKIDQKYKGITNKIDIGFESTVQEAEV